jgi:hypothetical protein
MSCAVFPRSEPLLVALLHRVDADRDVGLQVPEFGDVLCPELDVGIEPHHVSVIGSQERGRHLVARAGDQALVRADQPVVRDDLAVSVLP